jgi:hypothetical protein
MDYSEKFYSHNAESATHESGWTVSYEDEFSIKYQDHGRDKIYSIEGDIDADHNLLTILYLDSQEYAQYKRGTNDVLEVTRRIHDALSYLNSKYSEMPGKLILEIAPSR